MKWIKAGNPCLDLYRDCFRNILVYTDEKGDNDEGGMYSTGADLPVRINRMQRNRKAETCQISDTSEFQRQSKMRIVN